MADKYPNHYRTARKAWSLDFIAKELVRIAATVREAPSWITPGCLGLGEFRRLKAEMGPTVDALQAHATDCSLDLLSLAVSLWPDVPRESIAKPPADAAKAADGAAEALPYLIHEITYQVNKLGYMKPGDVPADRLRAARKQLRITFAAVEQALDAIHPEPEPVSV